MLAMVALVLHRSWRRPKSDSSLQRHHVDADAHAVLAAADEDALDRADVAVVAAPGDVMWSSLTAQSFVGSKSTQPSGPHRTEPRRATRRRRPAAACPAAAWCAR